MLTRSILLGAVSANACMFESAEFIFTSFCCFRLRQPQTDGMTQISIWVYLFDRALTLVRGLFAQSGAHDFSLSGLCQNKLGRSRRQQVGQTAHTREIE